VIGGSVAFYEYEHNPKIEYQKGPHYYKDKNYKKALLLFKEAVKQGYAPAEKYISKAKYQEGLHYYKNKNYKKALPLFKESAKQGYAPAGRGAWIYVFKWAGYTTGL